VQIIAGTFSEFGMEFGMHKKTGISISFHDFI
jgi:hypothetical protein